MKAKLLTIVPIFLALFIVTSCNQDSMDASQDMFKRENNFNKPGDKTIFDLAVASNLTELYGAILYVDSEMGTNLEAAIKSNEVQLTVFAPTNEAFVNLLAFLDANRPETIDDITDIPAPIVLAVLQYHLTDGRRGSNSVVPKKNMKTIETFLEGATFDVDKFAIIHAAGGNTAQIGAGQGLFDISASNGIVHVIDTVILPLEPGDVLALWDSLIAS